MRFDLTEQDLANIAMWYGVSENERGTDTYEIGTLLKLGIKTYGVGGGLNNNRFIHDCNSCVLIGVIGKKYVGYGEWHWDAAEQILNNKARLKKQQENYDKEMKEKGETSLWNPRDINGVEYGYHDVYYCVETGSVVIRYGNKPHEYYSGWPEALKQLLKNMGEQTPNFSLKKVYERALDIFDESGIAEEKKRGIKENV